MRRPLIVVLLVLILAGVGAAAVVRLTRSPAPGGHPRPKVRTASASPTTTGRIPTPSVTTSPTPVPSSTPLGSVALTYLRGTRIVTRSLGATAEHTVADLHTADVSASPTSEWFAYVVPKGGASSSDTDFVRKPEVHLVDLASGGDASVGVGFDPVWKSDGTQVAYLAPDRPRTCDAESCGGAVRVMIAAPGVAARPITGFGHLHLLAWAGDRLLISDEADLTHTRSVATDGSRPLTVPVPPSKIWDASPDGRLLITVGVGSMSFTTLTGSATESLASFHMPGAVLGDGSWSSDPSRVAGIVRKRDGSSTMALLSPERGAVAVAGSAGAMGNVVWDPGADRFAFVAVDPHHRSRLRTVVCRMTGAAKASCRPWFSWSQGVFLLKLNAP